MHAALGGQSGAEVEELVDAPLDAVAYRVSQEAPVGAGQRYCAGVGGRDLLGEGPVGGEVVRPAEQAVIDARGVRTVQLDRVAPVEGRVRRGWGSAVRFGSPIGHDGSQAVPVQVTAW